MAIYSMSVKIVGRSAGRSAVSSAAYRSGSKMKDERYGEIYDFTRKGGVYGAEIIAPENAPDWVQNREQLWNEVERVERRKDSQLAREVLVSLPIELNNEQRQELTRRFVQEQFVNQGMIADIGYHKFDSHNPHAHIMLTLRHIHENGFGKKNREWDKKQMLVRQRKAWATHANWALEQAGYQTRIDHRSLEAQGINRIPQPKLGPNVLQMEAKGIRTRIGDEFRQVAELNRQLANLNSEYQNVGQEINPEIASGQLTKLAPDTSQSKRRHPQSREADLER
ncbi:MAG: MobQ family relaxase [Cyanobacteria bacterium J06635_15]